MSQQTSTDAIYVRQSIDKADSISIESQIDFCRYETRGAPCQIFADRGYSGKNTNRPEFQKLLREIRSGNIHRVICYKLDRCSRSILDFTTLMAEFQKYGVEFISCTEKFDTSTPMGRAMLNICIVFAQLERETIQQRVRDAYHSRSKKGFYMGGKTPFGFRREAYMLDGKRTSRFQSEPKEADILNFLYETYSKPGVSLGDLITELNSKEIINPRRSDGLWIRSHLGKLLANPVYVRADMGLYHYFEDIGVTICNGPEDFIGTNGCYLYSGMDAGPCLVLAPHEGLVSSELWLKCRKKHRIYPKRVDSHHFSWLTGHLFCGECGHRLVFSRQRKPNGSQYSYIVCQYAHGGNRSCAGLRGWKEETAETLLSGLLIEYLKLHYPTLFRLVTDEKHNAHEIRLTQIEREIEKITAKAMEASGALLSHLNDQISRLEEKKMDILQNSNIVSTQRVSPDYDKQWKQLSHEKKIRVLDTLVSRITLSNNSLTIFWRQKPSADCIFR